MRSTWHFLRRSAIFLDFLKVCDFFQVVNFRSTVPGRSEWFMPIAEFTTRTVLDPESTLLRLEDNPSPSASPPQGTVLGPYYSTDSRTVPPVRSTVSESSIGYHSYTNFFFYSSVDSIYLFFNLVVFYESLRSFFIFLFVISCFLRSFLYTQFEWNEILKQVKTVYNYLY